MPKTKAIKVGQLIDAFLADIAKYSAASTVEFYRGHLSTLRYVAVGEPIEKITDGFLREFIEKFYGRMSSSTQHGAVRAVVRLMNWAVAEGHIEKRSFTRFRKPAMERRNSFITPADYAALLKAIPTAVQPESVRPLKDAVRMLYHSGARPQELRAVEAAWVKGDKIVFPLSRSKGKRERVLLLDAQAKAIVTRLALENPRGPIFRNSKGKPWTKNAIVLAMSKLGKRAGVGRVCAYGFRHAYITRLLERGVDISTVAAIAGNSPEMVNRFYSHVGDNHERLLGIVQGA